MRRPRSSNEEDDGHRHYEEDDVPLHHRKAFGAGLKRKRVEFVRATNPVDDVTSTAMAAEKGAVAGDLYASIVLSTPTSSCPSSNEDEKSVKIQPEIELPPPPLQICEICALPITTTPEKHASSLAHLASLPHSHPPSSLDRARMGLRALSAQGWDPDARRGLGREGEGMRFPVKVKTKEDTLGIGAEPPRPSSSSQRGTKKKAVVEEEKRMLNAKEMRALAARERKRGERLQGEMFGSVDVEAYLRGDGRDNEASVT